MAKMMRMRIMTRILIDICIMSVIVIVMTIIMIVIRMTEVMVMIMVVRMKLLTDDGNGVVDGDDDEDCSCDGVGGYDAMMVEDGDNIDENRKFDRDGDDENIGGDTDHSNAYLFMYFVMTIMMVVVMMINTLQIGRSRLLILVYI